MKILSLVIPTYNMEAYLPRCLDSLIQDSSILEELEVLVVNDGSKDKSLEIAQQYAIKYPDTVKAIDKPNGNYGSCVNRGLLEATGKYFRILDADDWVDSKGLVKLISVLKNITVDAVFTNYTVEMPFENKSFDHAVLAEPKNRIIEKNEFNIIKNLQTWDEDLAMHKLTYRTQFLRNINFVHTEGISYTDTEYVFYPLTKINSLIFVDAYLYKYFVGREGQTVSVKSKINTAHHLKIIIERMVKNVNLNEIDNPIQRNWCLAYLSFVIASYYHRYLVIQKLTKQNSTILRNFDNYLKVHNNEVYLEMNNISIKGLQWIKLWRKYNIQIINPQLYSLLTKMFKKY